MNAWSIEAYYDGTRYRSRTEARWAMMFDAAQVEFQYEPEGFDFGKAKYVPDFWLPGWDSYFEIKRDGFLLRPGEWSPERCVAEQLNEATKKDVFLAPGSPRLSLQIHHFQLDRVTPEQVYLAGYFPASCIEKARKHRFDWKKDWRQRPRRIYDGEGAIGLLATDILKNMRKE